MNRIPWQVVGFALGSFIVTASFAAIVGIVAINAASRDEPAVEISSSCDDALAAADQLAIGAQQAADGLNPQRFTNEATQLNYERQMGQIAERYQRARLACP